MHDQYSTINYQQCFIMIGDINTLGLFTKTCKLNVFLYHEYAMHNVKQQLALAHIMYRRWGGLNKTLMALALENV